LQPIMERQETPMAQPNNGFVIKAGSPSTQVSPSVQNVPLASRMKAAILQKAWVAIF
jgi:hypothetical protein